VHRFYNLLTSWGPLGVGLFALTESLGVPNPGGTDLLLIVISATRPGQAPLCALLAILGSLGGTAVFFEIMRRGGEALLARRTGPRRAKLTEWFDRYGLATVFVTALVPIPGLPFKFFVGCAGALGVSRLRFLLTLAVARVPSYFALAYLGAVLGDQGWPWLKSHTWHLVVGAAVLVAVLFILLRRSKEVGQTPDGVQR
jgi:membrane protein DedA with SNARE-associated domain